jgi:hypothetical protein
MLKIKNMKRAKLKTQVFIMRISMDTRKQMDHLVSNSTYKNNKTSLIENLISEAFFKSFKQNAK